MPSLLRPTLHRAVALQPDEAARAVHSLFAAPDAPFVGRSVTGHVTVTVPGSRRRFWSPWMHVEVRASEDTPGTTLVHARFSPHPNIWTLFMLTYLALLTIICIAGAWGLSQWMLERPPTLFWVAGGAGVLGVGMFIASRVGQSLASDQMHELRDALDAALGAGPDEPA